MPACAPPCVATPRWNPRRRSWPAARRFDRARLQYCERGAVAAGNLLAMRVETELRPPRVERSLVRQIVDDPAERVHRQNPAPLVLRQKAEGVMEGRSRGGARAARRRSGPDARCDVAS